jgi:hypothetical protein
MHTSSSDWPGEEPSRIPLQRIAVIVLILAAGSGFIVGALAFCSGRRTPLPRLGPSHSRGRRRSNSRRRRSPCARCGQGSSTQSTESLDARRFAPSRRSTSAGREMQPAPVDRRGCRTDGYGLSVSPCIGKPNRIRRVTSKLLHIPDSLSESTDFDPVRV